MPRYYLTTAIDYVNSRPHLGTAYEKVAADVIARYRRLAGYDVHFLMGNDEHSQNVFKQAQEAGLDPVAYCDQMEQEFRRAWAALDISFDDFIRTTQERHRLGVVDLATRLYVAGDIYKGTYEGWYCVSCEAFKQEKDLAEGRCPLHPQLEPQWLKEDNYFFRLSKYQQPLLDHITTHPDFIQPEPRRNEILRLLESGLEDVSVSRAGQSWGIKLPFDTNSVVYVWFDALINYASAVGLGSDEAQFAKWWPADLHVIGKDITRFHAVIWPAMLMAAKLPLPRRIFGHGFMTKDGQRMSKSNPGTIIDPAEAAGRLGADPLRLFLVKEMVFGSDGDFTWERFEERYNVDLANNLGNLVSRTTSMVERYRGGRLRGVAVDAGLAATVEHAVKDYAASMEDLELDGACRHAFRIVDATNSYIASSEPWTLAKRGDDTDLDRVLWSAVEALRIAAVLLSPVIPRSSLTILERLGAGIADVRELRWERDTRMVSEGERTITRADSIWPRIETTGRPSPASGTTKEKAVETTSNQQTPTPVSTPAAGPAARTDEAATGIISIDEFMKVDLRVGQVLTAERVPKSKKLMKLSVDMGSETRTIVAGIAEAYEPDALVGRRIAVVANLAPAKLMGIESNGMVLAATTPEGRPILVDFEQPPVPGARIR
jgi:methionyl-tRNA synthetase